MRKAFFRDIFSAVFCEENNFWNRSHLANAPGSLNAI